MLRDTFTTRSGREVALELYVDRGNLDRAPWAMTSLKNSMKWDEERFGLEYDLDIYMIVAVDFFNMGAMENKGLNIFNSKYVLARTDTATDKDYLDIERVIGHEYFHNWTGNRVTCRDWFQLSLKEGLTVFRDQEFSSDLGSRAVNRINNVRTMRGLQFAEDASPMAHPIRPDMVIEMKAMPKVGETVLGDTLTEIARHKAGIIKPSVPCIVYPGQAKEVMRVIDDKCREYNCEEIIPDMTRVQVLHMDITDVFFSYKGMNYHLVMSGEHQIKNAL